MGRRVFAEQSNIFDLKLKGKGTTAPYFYLVFYRKINIVFRGLTSHSVVLALSFSVVETLI